MNTEIITTARQTAKQHQSHPSNSSHWSHSVVGVGGRGRSAAVDRSISLLIDICVE
jgi:hypothetical protein